jgi:hypothetical protein
MSEDNSEHEITINPKRVQVIHVPMSEQRRKKIIELTPSASDIFAECERHELNEFLDSVMPELGDQRIPEGNQQQEYAVKSALMKGLREAAREATEKAIAGYLSTHPEAKGLGFRFSGKAYIEKSTPTNYPLVLTRILDCILDKRAGFTSQKAILDSVKKSTNIKELNANIWNLPLKRYMKALLYKRLENHGADISLAGCSNMSEIRKTIATYYAKRQSVHKLKLDITITPNEIIVNDTSYKIINRQSRGYEYKSIRLKIGAKRPWLRVNELKVLFGLAL